jgi:aminopeptidase N
MAPIEHDPHSFARPNEVRVTHVHLQLNADFAAKRLTGLAALDLQRAPNSTEVVLDTRGLSIISVVDSSQRPLQYSLGSEEPVRGQPLTVSLPAGVSRIVVLYRTNPGAEALQWLAPTQTAGKQHPYLFSQGQAILTRTWIPTQDSPGIRQTYSAVITVPRELGAVMSAEQRTPEGRLTPDGRVFEFEMRNPIPPYLIALAVGDIAFESLGPRSGVYAEPSVLPAAAKEFADLEQMISAAESLYGPYRWGRYDILVLPPSFPFGGMENPRLTFATPTILAGDRSLTSLIAHELAHSWSGNLVTNATWRDFWLNEGFTSYFELRIMEQMYGAERAAMLEHLGRQGLLEEMRGFGTDTGETVLHIALGGRNPDDAMTAVAYDKGAAFLRMLEVSLGRERFDTYLRSYFDRHAFQSMTTAGFLADMRARLLNGDENRYRTLRIDQWVFGAGLPANVPQPRSDAFTKVEAQATAFARGAAASSLTTANWTTQEWQHFLGALPDTLSTARLSELDRAFGFSRTGNSEILFAWLRIAIANRYEPAMPALEQFLTSQGRRKFLSPLYTDLMATEWGKPVARRIYAAARPLYHSVATTTIDAIVK